ncbi:MAG: AraC family ligand binding domain-containing protein [Muribaculaceae bacterium]|nr:AraC family ligand binding domain-containing protein [Muribaculaceae bacterium]
MNTGIEKNNQMNLLHKVDYEKNQVVTVEVVTAAGGEVRLLALDKEVVIADHSVKANVLIQVLEGVAVIKVEDRPHYVRAGQTMLLAPDTVHAVYAAECCKILLTKINVG